MRTSRSRPRLNALIPAFALLSALCLFGTARAWINDRDQNKIDDRIERVDQQGVAAAFENSDPTKRLEIAVFQDVPLSYGIYVGYDHPPTSADSLALAGLGVGVIHPYLYISYIRSQATFAQIQLIAALPGVERVEAIPMMYTFNHLGSRVVRARDSRGLAKSQNYVLYPSARQDLGLDGTGIVIAILDTGVNDEQDSLNVGYPGHESVRGKFLGGGNFYSGQPALNTPLTSSWNPQDHSGGADSYHATHVAGTAMGTGGPGGYFGGVAPNARLVDCKVLSDAGAGFGTADGVAWCIYHKDTVWPGTAGTADSIYRGVQILSLSLGGTSNSDGTDASARMINAAVRNGLVACIATGNNDSLSYIASPASADSSIAVGAVTHNKTLIRNDDQITTYSNEGPRRNDGDADHSDEMKPSVVAPGDAIVSANGDITTDGTKYQILSGTSMATPHVSGVCALILQANRSLTPMQVRAILQNTAEHRIPSVKGPFRSYALSTDPNYDPGSGWGEADAYAACKEALNSTSGVQVTQILRPSPVPGVARDTVRWITQREYSFLGFDVYRAPDAGGSPGAFSKLTTSPIAPTGHSTIEGAANRTLYSYVDGDPSLELGHAYWYKVAWVDLVGDSHFEPPVPVEFGSLPRQATAYYSIIHSAADHDLTIRAGSSYFYNPGRASFVVVGPTESGQDSSRVVLAGPGNTASSTGGNVEHFWSIGFTAADGVKSMLPPSALNPWFLNVAEGGYVNRFGRLTGFSIFVNDSAGSASGTTYVTNSPTPKVTTEGMESNLWIPDHQTTSVESARLSASAEFEGLRVTLELLTDSPGTVITLYRSTSDDFATRQPLTASQAMQGTRFTYLDTAVEGQTAYYYWIQMSSPSGTSAWAGPVSASPGRVALTFAAPPQPNPVRDRTALEYTIGSDMAGAGAVPVRITLHDVQGRSVRTLRSGPQSAGVYRVTWDGADDGGRRVSNGVYYLRFSAGSVTQMSKVVLAR